MEATLLHSTETEPAPSSSVDVPDWLVNAQNVLAAMQSGNEENTTENEPHACSTLTGDHFDRVLLLVNAQLQEIERKLGELLAIRNEAPVEHAPTPGDTGGRTLRKSRRGPGSAPPNSRAMMSLRNRYN